MQKRILTILTLTATFAIAMAQTTFETSTDAVRNMRLGWNLGNTLDSNSGDVANMWIERWSSRRPYDYETAWGQVPATQELIDMFRNAGFNAIRVPVTWWPHMVRNWQISSDNVWDKALCPMEQYVDPAWMARVKETVDYVINSGMYCILNVHHDTGDASTAWLRASMSNYDANHTLYEYLWKRIAEEFKDYDEHLLFEGYNEMLDDYGSWCFASFAAPGNYNASVAKGAYDAINSYAQSFVSAVRATGGNNTTRNLVVNTYGACCGDGSWNSHLTDPLTFMQYPTDTAEGHVIFQVHYYPTFNTLSEGKTNVNTILSKLKTKLASKGAPVIIGEWGPGSGISYANNPTVYSQWASYFVSQAKASGIGTFHWMGLSDGASRAVPEFSEPDLCEALVKGYYGEDGYVNHITPVPAATSVKRCPRYGIDGKRLPDTVSDSRCKGKYLQGHQVYVLP